VLTPSVVTARKPAATTTVMQRIRIIAAPEVSDGGHPTRADPAKAR
jgi:hypothetical protein